MAKRKSRHGRLAPGGKGKAAKLAPGAAAGGGAFEPGPFAERFGLWWMNGDGENFLRETEEGWVHLHSRALEDEAKVFFQNEVSFLARSGDYDVSQWRQLLIHVRKHRRVEEILKGLAGYPSGAHQVGGERVLVKNGRVLPEGKAGDWGTIRELIESRLARSRRAEEVPEGEFDQDVYFKLWCKVAYEAQRDCVPGEPRRGHALVLVGENGSGKSFLQQHLITPLLGGREADPKMFLQGNDAYNSDVLGAEHLALGELAMPSAKMDARNELKERLKALIANTSHRMRCMRTEPLTVAPNWAFTHSLNSNHDSIRNYPGLEPGFRDKILMLRVDAAAMPMPTRTEVERVAFRDRILSELPAFIYHLTEELEIPESLKTYATGGDATRFGFREFQHPSLVAALFEDTNHAQLRDMIDSAWFEPKSRVASGGRVRLWDLPSPANCSSEEDRAAARLGELNVSETAGLWMGSHTWLRRLLLGEDEDWSCSVAKEFEKWDRHNPLPGNLKRLAEEAMNERFECVEPVPYLTRMAAGRPVRRQVRCWRIARG